MPGLPLATPKSLCNGVPALAAPLLDETTLAETLDALSHFVRKGGEAEILHQALLDHKNALPGNASWLRPFWDDAYLEWREPLPLGLNYCFRLENGRWGKGAADFVLRVARAAALLGRGELEAELNRAGPQAMDQARSLFYSRIPCPGADELLTVPLAAPPSITILCRGFVFLLPLYGESGSLVSPAGLEDSLAAIRLAAEKLEKAGSPVCPIGAVTTAPRERAASLRAALKSSQSNRVNLQALEQSLLVLCLAPAARSDEDFTHMLLAGEARNRWFDKSLQVIAANGGGFGINLEHAGCDAGIWAWLLDRAASLRGEEEAATDAPLPFRLLEWEAAQPLRGELEALEEDFRRRADGLDLAQASFPEFSRDALKALRTSPDAFLQVCFQLAQHSIFGELRSSYEAVSMRSYAGGRTECARGSTQAALVLAQAISRKTDKKILLELYRKAERAHLGRLVSCQRGQAVERYVFGLQTMWRLKGKELGVNSPPAFFSDPGWLKIKRDSLSTSGMAADGIRAFAFAPVVEDGFGIGYAPGRESSVITATSFRGSGLKARDFCEAFGASASRIAELLKSGA